MGSNKLSLRRRKTSSKRTLNSVRISSSSSSSSNPGASSSKALVNTTNTVAQHKSSTPLTSSSPNSSCVDFVCTVCQTHFHTSQALEVHMTECKRIVGVVPRSLMPTQPNKLIKVASGQSDFKSPRKQSHPRRHSSYQSNIEAIENEQLQLAMALSASLGNSDQPPSPPGHHKRKRKRALQLTLPPPPLLTTTTSEAQRILEARAEQLLQLQETQDPDDEEISCTPAFRSSSLASCEAPPSKTMMLDEGIKELGVISEEVNKMDEGRATVKEEERMEGVCEDETGTVCPPQHKTLWVLSASDEHRNREHYYVHALTQMIAPIESSCWSDERSPTHPTKNRTSQHNPVPLWDPQKTCTGSLQSLSASLGSLVGSLSFSDLTLVTGEGREIPAHAAILSTRCPRMKEVFVGGGAQRIDMSLFSYCSVLSLVTFLYSAELQVPVDEKGIEDLMTLAEIWGLDELIGLLKEVYGRQLELSKPEDNVLDQGTLSISGCSDTGCLKSSDKGVDEVIMGTEESAWEDNQINTEDCLVHCPANMPSYAVDTIKLVSPSHQLPPSPSSTLPPLSPSPPHQPPLSLSPPHQPPLSPSPPHQPPLSPSSPHQPPLLPSPPHQPPLSPSPPHQLLQSPSKSPPPPPPQSPSSPHHPPQSPSPTVYSDPQSPGVLPSSPFTLVSSQHTSPELLMSSPQPTSPLYCSLPSPYSSPLSPPLQGSSQPHSRSSSQPHSRSSSQPHSRSSSQPPSRSPSCPPSLLSPLLSLYSSPHSLRPPGSPSPSLSPSQPQEPSLSPAVIHALQDDSSFFRTPQAAQATHNCTIAGTVPEPCPYTPANQAILFESDDNITPMPDYRTMVTPQLKRHCSLFGIRGMTKKKMKAKLEEIYEYNHPLVDEAGNIITEHKHDDVPGKKSSCKQKPTGSSKQDKTLPELMDMVKRTITTDVELYNDILLYKPLQLASIQGKLKSAGTPVAKDKLMDILDQLCVTFTVPQDKKVQSVSQ